MFPAHELTVAAEDAYRRERLIAVRPPRRTRRSHRTRHPRPVRRRPFAELLLDRVRSRRHVSAEGPAMSRRDCVCAA